MISRGLLKATYGLSPWDYEHNETFAHYARYSCCGDAELARSFQLTLPTFRAELEGIFEESRYRFAAEPLDKLAFVPSELCEPIFSLHRVNTFDYVRLTNFKRRVEPLVGEDDYVRRIDLWDAFMPLFLQGRVSTGQAAAAHRGSASSEAHDLKRVESVDDMMAGPKFKEVVAEGWQAIPANDTELRVAYHDKDSCQRACERADMSDCLLWTFDAAREVCECSLRILLIGAVCLTFQNYTCRHPALLIRYTLAGAVHRPGSGAYDLIWVPHLEN